MFEDGSGPFIVPTKARRALAPRRAELSVPMTSRPRADRAVMTPTRRDGGEVRNGTAAKAYAVSVGCHR